MRASDRGELERAEAVFVLAGEQYRKVHAQMLANRFGVRNVVFSIGRFEWRRFAALGVPGYADLLMLVHSTPHESRHFFAEYDLENQHCRYAQCSPRRPGTLFECQHFADLCRERKLERVALVTSEYHLSRASGCFARCRDMRARTIIPVAAPEIRSTHEHWHVRPTARAKRTEWVKAALYPAVQLLGLGPAPVRHKRGVANESTADMRHIEELT